MVKIGLKIPNDPDDIHSYTLEVLAELSKHVALTSKMQRKIKLIVMELVTNSIKHSTDPDALIRLTIDHPRLTIEKIDIGLQIRFTGKEQLPFQVADKNINVSFAENKSHDIEIIDQYRFKFVDNFKEDMNVENLPEHFGLYIITMASDGFEYQHNPELLENSFIVNLKL
ncbi:ATP-binding protein [Pedobacter sp.]|uniref:ATP-binding protein n=1 Tax=Pedobacter sp. TaxID=1411316 RepID=UPI003D7F7B32